MSGAYKLSDMITGKDAGLLFIDATGKIYSTPNISLASYSSAILKADFLTGINQNQEENVLKSFGLFQNYPNPFNPITSIKFRIAEKGNVSLKVYDVNGKKVADLVESEKEAGNYEISFDGSKLSSGVYFYELRSGRFFQSKKMILMK